MFIATECSPKTRAPEERNVANDDSGVPGGTVQLGSSFVSAIFRSSGATKILWSPLTIDITSLRDGGLWLETLPEKQELTDLLHREHGGGTEIGSNLGKLFPPGDC